MMILFFLLQAVLWVLIAVALLRWLSELLRRRRAVREEVLMRRSTHLLACHLLRSEEGLPRLPLARLVGSRRLLASLLARLGGAAYGLEPKPFRQLVIHYRIDRYLVRGARRSRGLRRALYLKRLADLPPLESVRRATRRYLTDPSREVAFAALLVQLSTAPHEVLRLIASYPYRLTVCEANEVLYLLRRGLLPIAYRPLLESPNPNLQRVGLALVAQFAIEEADATLFEMLSSATDRPLAVAALRTLATLHRPLRRRVVTLFVQELPSPLRRSLMRRLAREGYAPRQVQMLFVGEQREDYLRMVESYKRSLVCG